MFAEMLKSDVGDRVELTIFRDGKYIIFNLILVEAPYSENTGQE